MTPRFAHITVAALAALVFGACTSSPDAGEYGRFRYAGRVIGEPPLRLLPPVADPQGNLYTVFGELPLPQVRVYASHAGGGESSNCDKTKGDNFGIHGVAGFDENRIWYWAGDALVAVTSGGKACNFVLDRHPGTDVNLIFKAVLPWIRDAPSRTSVVALVQSSVDPNPFSTMIDLNVNALSNVRAFDPGDAVNVRTIGVGANRDLQVGFVLLEYDREGGTTVEARFYDTDANETSRVGVPTEPLEEYAVQGYLEISDGGLVMGLLKDKSLVAFDRAGGRILPAPGGMEPIGIHRWEGKLWLVGLADNRPVVAEIDDRGQVGPNQRWTASEIATTNLRGSQEVVDDRTLPSRTVTWPDVRTGIGPYPFLSPFSVTRHATDTALWVVAGPQVDIGGAIQTSFAVVPVGISYP